MQGIGEQQQARNEVRLFSAQHRGLAASVRVPAKKDLPVHDLSHRRNRIAQAGAIALGVAGKWRSKTPFLPERQIATQDRIPMSAKSLGECDQQRSGAISARAMSQDQSVPPRTIRCV